METLLLKAIFFLARWIRRRFQRGLYKVSTWQRRDEDYVKMFLERLKRVILVKNAGMKIVPFFFNVMVLSSSKEFRYVFIFKTVTSKTM